MWFCLPHVSTHGHGMLTATAPVCVLPPWRALGNTQEIDALCAEWQPEPLVPRLTDAQQAHKEHVIAGCVRCGGWGLRGSKATTHVCVGVRSARRSLTALHVLTTLLRVFPDRRGPA